MATQPDWRDIPNPEVLVEHIDESPTNPRRRVSPDEDEQLLESVRAQGVLQAVLVRPKPIPEGEAVGRFELVFGHRRFRAARAAGLRTIPASVRALTDQEAIEAQAAENGGREDLHPLDEAEAFGRLRALGRTVEEIAARVGKSHVHVARRLRLLDLEEPVLRLIEEGKIDVPRALLAGQIADPKLQVEAAEEMAEPDWSDEPPSLSECRQIAQQRMRSLAHVPWALDDGELLASAGPCTTCPKRTGAQGGLFDAGADEDDYCTDGPCFAAKKQAHGERVLAEAAAKGQRTIPADEAKKLKRSWDGTPEGYRRLDATCTEDPKRRTYRQLLKKAKDAVVVAPGKDGEVLELVPAKGLAAVLRKAGHDFRAAKPAGSSRSGPPTNKGSAAVREEARRREIDAAWERAREVDELALLRFLVLAGEGSWENTDEIARCMGIVTEIRTHVQTRKEIERWVSNAPAPYLRAVLVLAEIGHESWTGDIPDGAAKALGIDRKAIAGALKADLQRLAAAEKQAAPKAAKKTPAKKARGAKAPKRAAKGTA